MSERLYLSLLLILSVACSVVWKSKRFDALHEAPAMTGEAVSMGSSNSLGQEIELSTQRVSSGGAIDSIKETIQERILSLVADKDSSQLSALMSQYAEQDPWAAWEWLRSLSPEQAQRMYYTLVRSWSDGATRVDPRIPFEALKGLSGFGDRYNLFKGFGSAMAEMGRHEEALIVLAESPTGTIDPALASSLLSPMNFVDSWVKADAGEVKRFLENHQDYRFFKEIAWTFLGRSDWLREDPKEALAWVSALEPEARESTLPYALTRWARYGDPLDVMDWIQSNAQDAGNGQTRQTLAERIADEDLELGIHLADTIQDWQYREKAYSGIWRKQALANPQESMAKAMRLEDPDLHLGNIFSILEKKSPSEAIVAASLIQEAGEREKRYRKVLEAWRLNPAMQNRLQVQIDSLETSN